MDISSRKIWQQASGDTDRDYAEICLKWDVILNGPGHAGPWPECEDKLVEEKWSSKKRTDLRRFCEEMNDGDIVVLRQGTSKVLGVGEIVGNYKWLALFGDIDGWAIQHTRRVRWLWNGLENPQTFDTYTLKQGDTTQLLDSPEVRDWINGLEINHKSKSRNLIELPNDDESQVSIEEISEYLFDKGVASASIELLVSEIDELIRIAKWYQKFGDPSETETVVYLAVPLLRALGWTPQKMAIEWNRVDIALFNNLPREDKNLTIVVEAKKKGNSCLSAASQAQEYAQKRPDCKRLVVTDGLRYGVYIRNKSNSEFSLHSYMNLTNLKDNYPVYDCRGTKEALLAMTPEWTNQNMKG